MSAAPFMPLKSGTQARYAGTENRYRGLRLVVDRYNAEHHGYEFVINGQRHCIPAHCVLPVAIAAPADKPALPTDSAERKRWPMFAGLLRYFPAALAQVSNHSFIGNEKHNPGLPLQHARGKSGDHEDCIVRHLVDAAEHPAGSPARIDELRALAWRTLALLQEECELAGHRTAPAASFPDTKE